MKFNLSGVNTAVIVRALISIIAAINIIFGYLGWHLIPLKDNEVNEIVNAGIVVLTAIVWAWGWWKNNSLTLNAQKADAFLRQLNGEGDPGVR